VSDSRKLFGTDGVRGVANVEPMTSATVMRLGMAVAVQLEHTGRKDRVVIGKDTRRSGYMFETALSAGIVSMGGDVWLTGPLPTPGIAFITSSMRADAGVVISASHNPYQDNGIKLFSRDGYKLDDAVEADIERLMESPNLTEQLARSDKIGNATRIDDALGRYIVFCKYTFPRDLTLDGIKIVVDCAHGAAYRCAPQVFEELGADVVAIHASPDGTNINDDCGALYPEAMCQRVVAEGAHLGIALDGDADRAVLCDERGNIIDGDAVMALCATRMIAADTLAHRTVVATVMSNIGLERAIRAAGGTLLRTDVGDRYVVEAMRRGGYNFGGEQSGHLVFLDVNTTGDGIVAGLHVLGIMAREQKSLSDLAVVMQRSPQVLVNVVVGVKRPLDEMADVQSLIGGIEAKLGDEGRVLVRYSGTEPKARVMIEGPDEAAIRALAEEVADAIKSACGVRT
jgi:phosphoglucosamine mutase